MLDLARTVPMMASRRVVVVLSAERLLAALRDADGGEADLQAFGQFLNAPEPFATSLLVTAAPPDGRLKATALLEKHAVVVECNELNESGGAGAWVRARAAEEGIRIEPAAVRLLADLAGTDIGRLRAEFDRVMLYATGDGLITEAAVRAVAGAPTTRDPWALTGAVGRGAAADALRELAMKLDAGEEPVMILGQLAWFVRAKMNPARAAAGADAVFRTDVALKTTRGEPRVLLERLVVELCG
jgi:DNA polymerase-3 subunit delta